MDNHSIGAVPSRSNAMHATQWPEGLPRAGNRVLPGVPAVNDWYDIRRVDERTFALIEPYHFQEVISYLLLGDREALLLDTGMGFASIRAEVAALTDLPVTVVNTHSHFDHVAGDHLFERVWAYDNDEEVARIQRGLTSAECRFIVAPGEYIHAPAGFDPAGYHVPPARVARRLRHGERIDLGGRLLEVLHTPGHSSGSLCLLDEGRATLFSGDTFYPGTLYAHFDASSLEQYLSSLDLLAGLVSRIERVCPAHNEAQVGKEMLVAARDAMRQIQGGQRAPQKVEDGVGTWLFDGFGVMARVA